MTSPSLNAVDVAIVGDGLIGLSAAYHLLRRGRTVAVFTRTTAGQASTAAAGMLTPACEFDPWMAPQFLDLLKAGKEYYPEFLSSWTTFPEVGYRDTDFMLIDLHERTESLQSRMEWLPKLGFDCEWLEPGQVCEHEPHLTPTAFRGGLRVRDEALVNPIALWEALREQVVELGAQLIPGGAGGLDERGDDIVVTSEAGVRVTAERVVLAAGSWSSEVAAMAGLEIEVCPAKGQMVQLSGPAHLINSVIYMPSGGCGSIVERAPGQYILGTSEEYLDPHSGNTAGVVGTILSRLCAVLPAATEWRIERTWAGFRPMTSDELPIIDAIDGRRFIVATGHHRNGVLLAPVTGSLVAGMVCDDPTGDLDLSPFRYARPTRPYARFASKY